MIDRTPAPAPLPAWARRAPDSTVLSPCVSVCRMNPSRGICEGCLRTLDEIAAWGQMDDDARLAVWAAIDRRRAEGA